MSSSAKDYFAPAEVSPAAKARGHQSIRLFKNPYLEKLTHVHPIIPLLVWTPLILFLFSWAALKTPLSALAIGLWAFGGLLFWTLAEYFMHRWLFHFDAKNRLSKRMVYLFHGIHHDDPHDPTRLVMPPVPGLAIGAIFFGIFYLSIGAEAVLPAFAGFGIGYLIYDYTHYATHHFVPRTKVGKFLRRYHLEHHFLAHDARWGVSSPLWDFVFGSYISSADLRKDSKPK